jgi:SAM-dependent methyltransferase
MSDQDDARRATIADFGAQWTRFTANDGFYGSQALWRDIAGPLVPHDAFEGKHVVDIGSGTGRIVNMLLDAGAAHVTAVEPSEGFATLAENTAARSDRVRLVNRRGDDLPADIRDLDWAVSIGVLHHVPEPVPVVRAMRATLRPGGRILVWLYGREGNGAYLAFALPLRAVCRRLPPRAIEAVAWCLTVPLSFYAAICARLRKLPLAAYLSQVIRPLTWRNRMLVVYDQLAPAWAEYYTEGRVRALLTEAGFVDIELHHRHGYSWTAIGTNPGA